MYLPPSVNVFLLDVSNVYSSSLPPNHDFEELFYFIHWMHELSGSGIMERTNNIAQQTSQDGGSAGSPHELYQ